MELYLNSVPGFSCEYQNLGAIPFEFFGAAKVVSRYVAALMADILQPQRDFSPRWIRANGLHFAWCECPDHNPLIPGRYKEIALLPSAILLFSHDCFSECLEGPFHSSIIDPVMQNQAEAS
jgi:hypothetical protein